MYPEPLFDLPTTDKEDSSNVLTLLTQSLKKLGDFLRETGNEAQFEIVKGPNCDKTISMIKDIGQLDDAIVDTWHHDLLHNGVYMFNSSQRHPLCDYDAQNAFYLADGLLFSCSDQLEEIVKDALPEIDDRSGPKILWEIIRACESANDAVVHDLCDKLGAKKLTSIPGEDMQVFSLECNVIIRQIRARSSQGGVPSDLTDLACRGVVGCTDPSLSLKATQIVSVVRPKPSPEVALQQLTSHYRTLKLAKVYQPLRNKESTPSAFQALESKVNKLQTNFGRLVQQDKTSGKPPNDKSNDVIPWTLRLCLYPSSSSC